MFVASLLTGKCGDEAAQSWAKSGNLAFVNRRRINTGAPGGKRLSDFVALLIAVAAFLVTMMVGQGLIVALHGAFNYSVIAFGPVLRLAAGIAIGVIAYRKLHRG